MPELKTSTTVRVQVIVDVEVGCWEESSTFKSLYEQAAREALQTVQGVLAETDKKHNHKCRLVGQHKIIFVTSQRDY